MIVPFLFAFPRERRRGAAWPSVCCVSTRVCALSVFLSNLLSLHPSIPPPFTVFSHLQGNLIETANWQTHWKNFSSQPVDPGQIIEKNVALHFPGSLWEGYGREGGGGGGWNLPFQAGDYNHIESVITDWSTAGTPQHQQQHTVNLPFQLLQTVYRDAVRLLFLLFKFYLAVLRVHQHLHQRSSVVNGDGLMLMIARFRSERNMQLLGFRLSVGDS